VKVTACVVSWNTADHLPGVLRSLMEQAGAELEIVVVDNASEDGSAEVARGFDGVRVVANAMNHGFAGAANQGVDIARRNGSEAFLVCNPDIVLEPGYVERATCALRADRRRGAVQGKLWRWAGPIGAGPAGRVLDTTGHLAFRTRLFRNRGGGQPDNAQFDREGPVFGVSGALALYRIEALEDVACTGEVFDEDLFAFWEDVDLDWRMALRGWHVWYEPRATAWHERGGAGPRRSAVVERLNFRNRFLVVLKNDAPAALAKAMPGVALTSLLKTGDLVLTVPDAFLRSAGDLRLIGPTLARRRIVQERATVDPAAVVNRWFTAFDYGAWVREWWSRTRGRPDPRPKVTARP